MTDPVIGVFGCLDPTAFNFNDYGYDGLSNVISDINGVDVNTSNGVCIEVVNGCTDIDTNNYNFSANNDDRSCSFLGCTDVLYLEFDSIANLNDGSCLTLIEIGCMDQSACNFVPSANISDGGCIYVNPGYTCAGVIDTSYTANELKSLGISDSEIINSGYLPSSISIYSVDISGCTFGNGWDTLFDYGGGYPDLSLEFNWINVNLQIIVIMKIGLIAERIHVIAGQLLLVTACFRILD